MHLHTINFLFLAMFYSKIAKNIILIMFHLLDFWILRSPLIHDIVGYYDHRKDSLQVNQPIPCMGLTQWLEQRHIWL